MRKHMIIPVMGLGIIMAGVAIADEARPAPHHISRPRTVIRGGTGNHSSAPAPISNPDPGSYSRNLKQAQEDQKYLEQRQIYNTQKPQK